MAPDTGEFLVIGLGRFGASVARTLDSLGYDVLAIDADLALVQAFADELPNVMQADASDVRVLRQLGAADVTTAVVCIGSSIEASVLTTVALADIGVPNIWAKAVSPQHGQILERVGAHHVMHPEVEMGVRVAHLLTGRMSEYVELDEDFVLVETKVPPAMVGKRLGDVGSAEQIGVTVVCVQPQGSRFAPANPDTVLGADDLLIAAGSRSSVDEFVGRA